VLAGNRDHPRRIGCPWLSAADAFLPGLPLGFPLQDSFRFGVIESTLPHGDDDHRDTLMRTPATKSMALTSSLKVTLTVLSPSISALT
jgi:hypothetical protein